MVATVASAEDTAATAVEAVVGEDITDATVVAIATQASTRASTWVACRARLWACNKWAE